MTEMREKIDELLRKVYDEGFNDGTDVEQGVAGAPDWEDTRARKAADAVLALIAPVMVENERYRAALEPFAKAADIKLCGEWADDKHFSQTDVGFYLTFGDLRQARAALSTKSEKQDG
jgi:hypothetical protein